MEARVIEVPIDNSNDVLEIDCSQLPEQAAEICDILENEGSALRFYQLFALEYYKQGQTEEAVVGLKRGIASAKANDQTAKVPLLNLLASIYVQKAKAAAGPRDMLLQMATTLLTEAEKISRTDPNTYLVKGMLAMTKRLPDAAVIQFNNALRIEPLCLAALLGKARALYGKRQFQQALAIYQQVLTLRPRGKPDARIGIGMCLYKLGHMNDARRALRRAVEVDPSAAAPHILLATMDLNEVKRSVDPRISRAAADPQQLAQIVKDSGKFLQRAMENLQRAYELRPENPAVLICLADRLFCKSDYANARKLAERALENADTMAIRAEAHYQIARSYHAAKQFDMAYEAYGRCLAINDKHSLGRYGLAQMQLQRTDMSSAEATLQRVLERQPRCVEALRALGYLHARLPNTKAKALEYYEREMQVLTDEAVENARVLGKPLDDPSEWLDDANLFLEAGQLYESSSAKKARKAYSVAAAILQRDQAGGAIPELWNNLGAMGQLTNESDESVFAEYREAVERCTRAIEETQSAAGKQSGVPRRATDARRLENTLVTTTYNTARFYEHCGLWQKSEVLYRGILSGVPLYIDARLRLGYIAYFCRANSQEALAHISQAIEMDAKRTSAWLMRGSIELQRRNVQDARRAFEHVLKDISKHDIYALCSLGNYYLAAGKSESSRAAGEANSASSAAKKAKELSAQNYKRALEFFDKSLQLDERCVAAAHGAAIAMAERGHAADARGVFQEVRDAATAGLGPATLCNPAGDLVFKVPRASGLQPEGDALQGDDVRVSCDVLLWSGVNAAHACVEIGNYRQAILAYEACLKRLGDTTIVLEQAAARHGTDGLTIPALEARPEYATDENLADTNEKPAIPEAERNERERAARDLRLYLTRALYIQAKATKDLEVMRTALREIRKLCTIADISLPESASADGAAADTEKKEAIDTEGDVEMGSTSNNAKAGEADKKPRVRLPPEDALVLFDLALVEQSVAQLASDLAEDQRTLADIDAAVSDLEHSTRVFTFLASWGKALQKRKSPQKLLYSPRLANERAGYGKSLETKLTRKRQEQEAFERQRKENIDQWRKQREQEEERKREEEARVERERRAEEERILRETEERNIALREEMARAAMDQEPKSTTKDPVERDLPREREVGIKSNKSKAYISDSDADGAEDYTPGESRTEDLDPELISKPVKRRLARGRVRNTPIGGHTDEEDTDTAASRKRRNVNIREGDDAPAANSDRSRRKAVVSDSDGEAA